MALFKQFIHIAFNSRFGGRTRRSSPLTIASSNIQRLVASSHSNRIVGIRSRPKGVRVDWYFIMALHTLWIGLGRSDKMNGAKKKSWRQRVMKVLIQNDTHSCSLLNAVHEIYNVMYRVKIPLILKPEQTATSSKTSDFWKMGDVGCGMRGGQKRFSTTFKV